MIRSIRRLCFVSLVAPALLVACGQDAPPAPATIDLDAALSGDRAGFERAIAPREFRFPADHGPHRDFRTEWWYSTGNLEGPDGEPYGFHFTIFRSGLAATSAPRTSRFATDELWMAHFALTDGRSGKMHSFERFARGAAGLGGASDDPLAVWVDGWRFEGVDGLGEGRRPTFHIRANQGGFGIDLELAAEKPLVLQGDEGLSQKGAEPGSASYYYALTRLAAKGSVRWEGQTIGVRGQAWLDREWSTSLLEVGQVGWDWFALQLDDGTDLMVYRMRTERDGEPGVDPKSHGALVDPEGKKVNLELADFSIRDLSTWTSPRSGAVYPGSWRISVVDPRSGESLELDVTPLVPDQELEVSVLYWEGAVTARGTFGGRPVTAKGYAELTGYGAR